MGNEKTKNLPEEKIHVMLYGGKGLFGGKEKPLVADTVYCSCPGECQLRSDGMCACIRNLALISCPYGRVESVKGYTSRAKKYHEFRNRYRNDEKYGMLDTPRNAFVRLVGDYVALSIPHVNLRYDGNADAERKDSETIIGNGMFVRDPFFIGDGSEWFPKDILTAEMFVKLFKFRPQAFIGGEIREYQEKTVAAVIEDMRIHWPEMYAEINELAPEICAKEVDYTGRRARLNTLQNGIEIKDSHGNKFIYEDGKLICRDYNGCLVGPTGVDAANATVEIPVTDKHKVEIKDNSWVDPDNTVFC